MLNIKHPSLSPFSKFNFHTLMLKTFFCLAHAYPINYRRISCLDITTYVNVLHPMKALFLLHYVISPWVEWIEQPPTPCMSITRINTISLFCKWYCKPTYMMNLVIPIQNVRLDIYFFTSKKQNVLCILSIKSLVLTCK